MGVKINKRISFLHRTAALAVVFLLSFSGVAFAMNQVDKEIDKAGENRFLLTTESLLPTTYWIEGEQDFLEFRDAVACGKDFANDTVNIACGFHISKGSSVGSEEHPFRGIFDGQGNTLVIQGNEPLFATVGNAKLKNIRVERDFLPESTYPGEWLYKEGTAETLNCSQTQGE